MRKSRHPPPSILHPTCSRAALRAGLHAHSGSILVLLRSGSDTVRQPAVADGPALNAALSRSHYTKDGGETQCRFEGDRERAWVKPDLDPLLHARAAMPVCLYRGAIIFWANRVPFRRQPIFHVPVTVPHHAAREDWLRAEKGASKARPSTGSRDFTLGASTSAGATLS